MLKRILLILLIALLAAPAALAQSGGGGGHGGGGRSGRSAPAPVPGEAPKPRAAPNGPPEIIGVVKAIDPTTGRVTIAYEAVEALGWPAGSMPFAVSKTALLGAATVGQKVRFRLEDQQISELRPF
ncbi:copper-binding protein [Phenylobacterium sp.]|uniref:copper-binding protein n=1 Tax=Phenylobacterium sp. TaxID=1871053 RepID=UPI0035659FAB